MKKRNTPRSDCPISFSLELVGDTWSLLIIRDLAYTDKRTFNEFLQSGEGIARNILADRLAQLVAYGLITKSSHPTDGRKDVYELTQAGLDLVPALHALSRWGTKHKTLQEVRL